MEFNIKTTQEEFYYNYLLALNGTLRLSNKELIILSEFIKYTVKYFNEPELVFSSVIRKKVQAKLKISSFNVNNYIKTLKQKKIILSKNQLLYVNPNVIPRQDKEGNIRIVFNFTITE